MNGNHKYVFINKFNLILEKYFGTVTISDLIEIKKSEALEEFFFLNINYIADFRNVKFDLAINDLNKLVNFLLRQNLMPTKRLTALLTNEPNHVVWTTLYKEQIEELPIKIGIFSTIDASCDWVGISKKYHSEIEEYLRTIKNH